VANWGYISPDKGILPLLRKSAESYQNELYKTQLNTGLFLLDIYLHSKKGSKLEYIMVIGVSRMAMLSKERIYILKVTSEYETQYLKTAVTEGVRSRKRNSGSRKKMGRTFDSKPFSSIERRY
jgi:hypothetical protein